MASSKCSAGSLSPLPCRELEKLHKIQSASKPQSLWRGPGLATLNLQVEVWGKLRQEHAQGRAHHREAGTALTTQELVRGCRIVTRAAMRALNPWSDRGRRSRPLLPGWGKPASSESSTGREHPKWSFRNLTFTQNCHCTDKKTPRQKQKKMGRGRKFKWPIP